MKKMMMVAAFLLSVVSAFAGENVDLSALKGEQKINFVVDWADLTIDRKPVPNWLEVRQADQPDWDAKKELNEELKPRVDDLVEAANKKLSSCNLYLSKDKSCKYTLVLKPQNVSKKGDNIIKCEVKTTSGKKTIAEFSIAGKGGMFGSMSNLWGDGFKDSGKKLGNFIKKALK